MWQPKALYIGSHFWFVPVGAAITSPAATTVTQNGTWPDGAEPTWNSYALGIIETFDTDPKPATKEVIIAPMPGSAQAIDVAVPYAIPEVKFTTAFTDVLAIQLAHNTQQLWGTATTNFTPNGGGAPGMKGILKVQNYDQFNNAIFNWWSWVYLELSSALKGGVKAISKPEYMATLLYSPNNSGLIN